MGKTKFNDFEYNNNDMFRGTRDDVYDDQVERRITQQSEAILLFKQDVLDYIYWQPHIINWLDKFSCKEWDDFLDTL